MNQSRNSTLEFKRIGASLGAEVGGIDLAQPLDGATVEALTQAHAEHEVLIFRDQEITAEHQKAFGRRFGELTVHPFAPRDAETPELIVFDNDADNPPWGTDVWHSDETFRAAPPMGTMLRALIVPEIGGDTMFTSMSAAFEGLSDRLQQFVSGLEAVHDFKPFRQLFSGDAEGRRALRDFDERYPPATHPVVRLHPVSGRKVLFVNPNFTVAIEGMGESESHALLEQLYRQASVPEYQIRHQWRPHTLVFWDNRSVQHYAIHDFYPQRRKMERVTIKGDRSVGVEAALGGASVQSQKSNRGAGDKPRFSKHGPMDVKEPERA
jgi:taurine dioxygenase